ncbi:hypothetical protein ACFYNW_28665 [Streptomyces virginiae]|uniref:hypothetical protein n=1 Tax=Streptomyces virginiae TaxID=1961 RepID=UPI0034202D70
MTNERETHAPGTTEPELPAKVPENGDAVTPDLPPSDPPAPDLWTADGPEEAEDAPRTDADHAAEAESPEPQEPTD